MRSISGFREPRVGKFKLFKQLKLDMDRCQSPDPIILPKNKDFFSNTSIFICLNLYYGKHIIEYHDMEN